jgi:CubicO group peptidase (beta-lactamase class C family)
MTLPKTHEEMLQIIAGSKPDFEPGAKAAYSNSNFVLLGYILEKVTGKTYSELLNTRIVKRIGLKNTYYGGKTSPEKQEAWSYSYLTDWIKSSETDMSIPGGAGALVSTPSDLTTFIHALFSGKLVSAASLDNMKTMTDGIGKGLFQFPFETRKAFGHSGGIDAFASSLTYFPDDDLALAYCTNGNSYPMNEILIGVLSIYFNRPYKIPTFKKVEIVSEQLDKYTGLYTSKDIPLKITIAKKDNILTGQATGQPVFPLEASAMHTFKFEPAGIVIEFDPDNKAFILKQGGMSFHYTLEVTP